MWTRFWASIRARQSDDSELLGIVTRDLYSHNFEFANQQRFSRYLHFNFWISFSLSIKFQWNNRCFLVLKNRVWSDILNLSHNIRRIFYYDLSTCNILHFWICTRGDGYSHDSDSHIEVNDRAFWSLEDYKGFHLSNCFDLWLRMNARPHFSSLTLDFSFIHFGLVENCFRVRDRPFPNQTGLLISHKNCETLMSFADIFSWFKIAPRENGSERSGFTTHALSQRSTEISPRVPVLPTQIMQFIHSECWVGSVEN